MQEYLFTDQEVKNRNKWLTALRSGDYKQYYNQYYNGKDQFCAVGLLFFVTDKMSLLFSENGYSIRENAAKLSGLSSSDINHIIRLNDEKLKKFPEIANHIEFELNK